MAARLMFFECSASPAEKITPIFLFGQIDIFITFIQLSNRDLFVAALSHEVGIIFSSTFYLQKTAGCMAYTSRQNI
jgi:hypothetical protein